ncbi:MAG: sigma 54-interacting transcriptional regulator [Desulfobacterales bacterium]|nr:sigma 54-interacting transcriptional regulator [Desulfobacterales bacterium]
MIGHELDRYWKTVVNTISDGIMIVNTSGAIVSVNKALEKITGYSREELIGKPCKVMDCDACKEAFECKGDQWCYLFMKGSMGQRKCKIRRKDGNYIHALKNAAILHDDEGNMIGAVGTISDLSEIIEKDSQLEACRQELRSEDGFHGIIGISTPMQRVFDLVENAAHSDAAVIIYGESGTGKELVSKAIHIIGERKNQPFIKVNCASLTESLLESELFGHVRGAFTGAYKDRIGRFEKANGGDIFLDEIGDLPMSTQVKMLRVLEEKMIERVGASTPIPTDVRIISATNRDLMKLVEQGKFRKDFYFRINVIPIILPPLRERVEDIPLLAEFFFRKMRLKKGKDIEGISNDAMELLVSFKWPGNVRELKSAFEYAFVTCHESMIRPYHFPATIYRGRKPAGNSGKRTSFNLMEIEKQELLEALEKVEGNQSKAADILGISRVTVWNRMRRFGINSKRKIEVV